MKVIALRKNPNIYTCNAYFVLGDFKTLQDVNALVDVGTDNYVLSEINSIYTGVGKKGVERIVLTHEHFDHQGGVKDIVEKFSPEVCAYLGRETETTQRTRRLEDGEHILLGDADFEVIYTPGHSDDSICLYSESEKTLFSGDTPLKIMAPDSTYDTRFITALEKLVQRDVRVLYTGHDGMIDENVNSMIRSTLTNVLRSLSV